MDQDQSGILQKGCLREPIEIHQVYPLPRVDQTQIQNPTQRVMGVVKIHPRIHPDRCQLIHPRIHLDRCQLPI
jgi:hypothetical protein